jgi:serine/threonine protein kinase/tetratricopeptide (TPR) repeat protein
VSDGLEPLRAALADRYRLDRELGAGGMATVYLAQDLKHDRPVALKVLRPELAASLGPERFLAEIRLTAKLQHPHIVALFDSGEAGGFLYYVMPYIEGESLRARLERDKRLDVEAMLAVARPVAQALAYAHELGVVHRDIKPENILLSRGQPFVTDFGIARAVTVAGGERLTATGLAIGTPAYMSPEQALGDEALDARSDVYSLGCVIYELLVGEPPFIGATVQALLARRLTGPPPHLTGVPAAVDEVVRRSLATAPQDRFATAVALADALVEAARRPATPELSLVVLPFENLSPDPDNAFFADGLTEEIIAALTKVRALRVISRTSAMLLRGSKKDVPTIARDLNVRYVLEGSVRRAGSSLRITAQLIDGATDAHLWAERYSGTLDDVFDLQERLARSIVAELQVALAPDESRRLGVRATSDPRAYELWLRVMHESRQLTKEGAERALQMVNQALATFGDDALLYSAVAYIHYVSYDFWFSHDEETLRRSEDAAARALALNPELSQAALSMALVWYKRGDARQFARYANRAVALERNADALGWWGFALCEAGRADDARAVCDEAVARDPFSFWAVFGRAVVDLLGDRWEEAYGRIRRAVETVFSDNPFAVWWLGQSAAYAAHDDEAKAALARVERMGEEPFASWAGVMRRALEGDHDGVCDAIERAGLRDAARSDEYIPAYLAACLVRVGEVEEALGWIERAISWGLVAHSFYETNRFFVPLRGHARFEALLELAREKERAFEV